MKYILIMLFIGLDGVTPLKVEDLTEQQCYAMFADLGKQWTSTQESLGPIHKRMSRIVGGCYPQ